MERNEKRNLKNHIYRMADIVFKWFCHIAKKCPLVAMLLVSQCLVLLVSLVFVIAGGYRFHIGMDHPLFVSVIQKEYREKKEAKQLEAAESTILLQTPQQETNADPQTQNDVADQQNQAIQTQYKKIKKTKKKTPYFSDPGKVALTTDYPYVKVGKKYYDDALFIGDSRIEGLKSYSGLTNATFYCKQGLTVYDMMSEKIAKNKKGKRTTIPNALKQKKFHKIYIMIGINELGRGTTKDYAKQYKKNIETIHKLQPEAVIFIMGVMHIAKNYSGQKEIVNNVNINDKNVAVSAFANGINVFYLDMNPEFTDKSGNILNKYTWDGVHLKAEYYKKWVKFLNQHGLAEDRFPVVG